MKDTFKIEKQVLTVVLSSSVLNNTKLNLKCVTKQWRRYVHDAFRLFHSENDALLLFNYINSRPSNIRFTRE